MIRPGTAPNGERARRRDLMRRPPPVESVAAGFVPADRVAESIRKYKQFLRDNVEIWRHTDRKVSVEDRRPKTSTGLARHQLLWTPAEIEKKVLNAQAGGNVRRPGPWVSTKRALDTFSIQNVPIDEDDDEVAEEKAEKARFAALQKLKASTTKVAGSMSTSASAAAALSGAAAGSGAGGNGNGASAYSRGLAARLQQALADAAVAHHLGAAVAADVSLQLHPGAHSKAAVPADAVTMKYVLAMQSLRKAVEVHPRPLVQLLYKSVAGGEGLDLVTKGGADIRAIRRKTFEDRITAILNSHPHFSPEMANVTATSERRTRERAIQRALRAFADIFNSFDLFHDNWVAHKPFVAALNYINAPSASRWAAFIFTALSVHDSVFHLADLHAVLSHVNAEIIPKATRALGRIPFSRATVNPTYVPPPPPRPLSASERSERMWGRAGEDRWSAQLDPIVQELQGLARVLFVQTLVAGVPAGPPSAVIKNMARMGDGALHDTIGVQEVDVVPWREMRALLLEHTPALAEVITNAML